MPSTEDLRKLILALGWTKAVFALFFFMMHGWIFHLYRGRLADRQAEINRLATDNRELRERLMALLDKHMGYTKMEDRRKREEE